MPHLPQPPESAANSGVNDIDTSQPSDTEHSLFKRLLGQCVRVPKDEVDEQERIWRENRATRKSDSH